MQKEWQNLETCLFATPSASRQRSWMNAKITRCEGYGMLVSARVFPTDTLLIEIGKKVP